jgi:DNA-binding transcriptional LysR family regulator
VISYSNRPPHEDPRHRCRAGFRPGRRSFELHARAEAAGTTQSAISLKLQKLERGSDGGWSSARRGWCGSRPQARRSSAARATSSRRTSAPSAGDGTAQRLSIGISEHAAGPELAPLIARISAYDPTLRLDVRIGFSRALLERFDGGALDAVLVRREAGRRDGEKLLQDRFGWFAAPTFHAGEPLRLATLAPPCGVHALARARLDAAKIKWIEAFVGGGIAAVAAAVTAGLGVAPLAARLAPAGSIDIGDSARLPKLPRSDVVLHSRVSDARLAGAIPDARGRIQVGGSVSRRHGTVRTTTRPHPQRRRELVVPMASTGSGRKPCRRRGGREPGRRRKAEDHGAARGLCGRVARFGENCTTRRSASGCAKPVAPATTRVRWVRSSAGSSCRPTPFISIAVLGADIGATGSSRRSERNRRSSS